MFKAIIAIITAALQFFIPTMAQKICGEDSFFYDWSAETAYSEEYVITMKKSPDKDFVILNLTDVQLSDGEITKSQRETVDNTIKELVCATKPDLITLTGDNAWGVISYMWLINTMESFDIPWAPVMGNHDGQNLPDEFWAAYELSKAKNCLFEFGPKGMGYGNYIINIEENGKIIHTLFMLDTHSEKEYVIDGNTVTGYDHLWDNQIEYYKWAVKGIAAETGKVVESTVFMHIPVPQYRTAWDLALAGNKSVQKDWGSRGEAECPPPVDNGFFDTVKALGSTKTMVVGHDHVNDYSVVYEGIRLAYGLKTGYGCYWDENKNGGTVISINSDGKATLENRYIETGSNK